MIGTKLVDSEKLFFGLAKLYIGDSATNEASDTAVLGSSTYYLSSLVNVAIFVKKEFFSSFRLADTIRILENIFLVSASLDIEVEFIEMTGKTLSYSLGGDGSDTNILTNLLDQSSLLRAELVFTYPNGTNTMTLIIPKAKVINAATALEFQSEEPMKVPMILSALYCTHANWSSEPLGKIIFA